MSNLSAHPDGREVPNELRLVWDTMSSGRAVLVATHANPDADAVASVLAVRLLLEGSERRLVATTGDGRVPRALRFLPAVDRLSTEELSPEERFDRIILVDCADPGRLGPLFQAFPSWFDGSIPIVNIDHHVTNTRFGTVYLVDPAAAATTEILTELVVELGLPLTPALATCLLTGIYGDTLGLQTSSTRPKTMRLAAHLLEAGADLPQIVTHLFRQKPFSTIRLWGLALSRARFEDAIVWTEITPDMLEQSGATAAEGEGIVNFLSGTEGALVAIMFYRQPDGWRVSLRSTSDAVDVARIASQFGGGGHSRAAGCRLPAGEEHRQTFLGTVARFLLDLALAGDPSQ